MTPKGIHSAGGVSWGRERIWEKKGRRKKAIPREGSAFFPKMMESGGMKVRA